MILPLLALVVLAFAEARHAASVPGCPDLDVLEAQIDPNTDFFNSLILCFCKIQANGTVDISCLYGSTLDHLRKATDAVKAANLTTTKITFQHIEFADSRLPAFAELAPTLISLEIRECTNFDVLAVPEATFEGLETTMKNLTIDSCNLKLRYLDLSGNFITNVETGSFERMKKVETLIIGEHNYINDTLIDAISSLKSLKTLDLSRADGIFEPPMELFDALTQLEFLKLSGCSIPSLEPGTFSSLKNLTQLDLRVNLIENISAYAFDGLSSLTRLSLAGNYIRNLEKEMWAGLDSLEEIDLGWNEIREVPENVFSPLSENLLTLNFRHNPLKSIPSTGLKNLRSLVLSECPITNFVPEDLKDYTTLETLDVSKCNLTTIRTDAFVNQKNSLKTLHLERNKLKTLHPKLLRDLQALEVLDISENPFICDDEFKKFILAIEDRYKKAAKEGKEFIMVNANGTTCDRPYTLKHQPLLDVNIDDLQPDLFVGTKTNETLFKEEPRREVYDFNKANDSKDAILQHEGKHREKQRLAENMTLKILTKTIHIVCVI
uniref:Leucine-rich repeat-containing protein 15 n=1 Tax=Angiostrongylus cantonensis TaxID=6313 RepID=A0A0K0CY42_ANGCA